MERSGLYRMIMENSVRWADLMRWHSACQPSLCTCCFLMIKINILYRAGIWGTWDPQTGCHTLTCLMGMGLVRVQGFLPISLPRPTHRSDLCKYWNLCQSLLIEVFYRSGQLNATSGSNVPVLIWQVCAMRVSVMHWVEFGGKVKTQEGDG
jgi:hypothetical protein